MLPNISTCLLKHVCTSKEVSFCTRFLYFHLALLVSIAIGTLLYSITLLRFYKSGDCRRVIREQRNSARAISTCCNYPISVPIFQFYYQALILSSLIPSQKNFLFAPTSQIQLFSANVFRHRFRLTWRKYGMK